MTKSANNQRLILTASECLSELSIEKAYLQTVVLIYITNKKGELCVNERKDSRIASAFSEKAERDEKVLETAARCLREELSIYISPNRFLYLNYDLVTYSTSGKQIILKPYLLKLSNFEALNIAPNPSELESVKWISLCKALTVSSYAEQIRLLLLGVQHLKNKPTSLNLKGVMTSKI